MGIDMHNFTLYKLRRPKHRLYIRHSGRRHEGEKAWCSGVMELKITYKALLHDAFTSLIVLAAYMVMCVVMIAKQTVHALQYNDKH